jgi:hypothetical protein
VSTARADETALGEIRAGDHGGRAPSCRQISSFQRYESAKLRLFLDPLLRNPRTRRFT